MFVFFACGNKEIYTFVLKHVLTTIICLLVYSKLTYLFI